MNQGIESSLGHILVAEDEEYLRRALWQILTLENYTVTCAENGAQGWELIEQLEIDLVITDLKMPRLDGIQLLQRIRSERPGLPVILMTGYGDSSTHSAIAGDHRCQLIAKPFDHSVLLATLKRALAE